MTSDKNPYGQLLRPDSRVAEVLSLCGFPPAISLLSFLMCHSQRRNVNCLRRTLCTLTLLLGMAAEASACPMCSTNIESDKTLPRAYMYSILFMLAVPPTVFAGIGVAIYRAHCRHSKLVASAAMGEFPIGEPAAELVVAGNSPR